MGKILFFQNLLEIGLGVEIGHDLFFQTMALGSTDVSGVLTVRAYINRLQIVGRIAVAGQQIFLLLCDLPDLLLQISCVLSTLQFRLGVLQGKF